MFVSMTNWFTCSFKARHEFKSHWMFLLSTVFFRVVHDHTWDVPNLQPSLQWVACFSRNHWPIKHILDRGSDFIYSTFIISMISFSKSVKREHTYGNKHLNLNLLPWMGNGYESQPYKSNVHWWLKSEPCLEVRSTPLSEGVVFQAYNFSCPRKCEIQWFVMI